MARLLTALIVMVMVAGCTSDAGTTTSTTATTLPATSTTAATTSTTTSTTLGSTTSVATTTTVATPLAIVLSGGYVAYTIDGTLVVEGWVDRPAVVTVGGTPTTSHTDPDGRTSFFAELTGMDVGSYEIPIEAMAGDDDTATVMLTVVHDPGLEREFAYLVEVDGEAGLVVADYAQWFTGEAAEQAAAEDGNANPDGTVDGGFYIRNANTRLRTLDVAGDAIVVLHACYVEGPCLTRESLPFDAFADLWADPSTAVDRVAWQWYGDGTLPYWLLIDDGTVVHIDEHYLP